jgi:Proteasome subunit A N-terminal signature
MRCRVGEWGEQCELGEWRTSSKWNWISNPSIPAIKLIDSFCTIDDLKRGREQGQFFSTFLDQHLDDIVPFDKTITDLNSKPFPYVNSISQFLAITEYINHWKNTIFNDMSDAVAVAGMRIRIIRESDFINIWWIWFDYHWTVELILLIGEKSETAERQREQVKERFCGNLHPEEHSTLSKIKRGTGGSRSSDEIKLLKQRFAQTNKSHIMSESRYAFSLTTFSPSGKLVQIEHALTAVSAGITAIGIKGIQT